MPPVVVMLIRLRPTGDEAGEVVAPLRVRHAERREDAVVCELLERLAAHPLDERRRDGVAGVRIRIEIANGIVERQLSQTGSALLRFRAGRYAAGLEYFRNVTRWSTGITSADQYALSALYTL